MAGAFSTDAGDLTDFVAREILEWYVGEPSVLAGALAHAYAGHLVAAVRDPSRANSMVAWLERTSAVIPLGASVSGMLRSAGAIVAPLLESEPDSSETIAMLDRGVARVLDRRSHLALVHPAFDDDLDGIIAAFLLRLEETDPLSAEHSRAVSLWCRRLAARLNFDDETIRFAARCGMLHDVGKARTPPTILHAPRALTDDEWTIMRDHTVGGARMLAEVIPLRPFEFAARSHHERLDGKGYPDRLEASDISTTVRIVTVADCFNAMIGRRPYRLPLSPAHALEQLVRHTGTQFDPIVVEAMIDIVERPAGAA